LEFQDTPASSFARTCSNRCGAAIRTNGCSTLSAGAIVFSNRNLLPKLLLPFPSGKLGHRA
jgi:hypothetical protein